MVDSVSAASLVVAVVAVVITIIGWRDDRRKLRALEGEVAALRELSGLLAERVKLSRSEVTARWLQVGIQGADFLKQLFGE
jgi:UDP-N-acetylmuramyl pentapeptide phosphotransferase/UDP-N-acetylglucosamine-1-phosphate transferase